jgi:hypothetical protein
MKQQGDVNIVGISQEQFKSMVAKAKVLKNGVVREGEGTHTHKMFGTDFRLYQLGELILGEMVSDDCVLRHVNVDDTQAEHKPIEMDDKFVVFAPTTEYDHFSERERRVFD